MKYLIIALLTILININTFAEKSATNYIKRIEQNFTPTTPTVQMEYLITYKVWFIRLVRIAKATVNSTEGIWIDPQTSQTNKACFVKLNYYTYDKDKDDRNRISLNDQIMTVLTMPELDTILYMKDTDEYFNPLFKTPTLSKNFEVYEMLADGSLDYYQENFIDGSISTNMQGAAALIEQGKDISNNIKLISEMYYGKQDFINHDSNYRIFFNVDGEVKPFSVKSTKEKAPVELSGKKPEAIKVRAELAKEATGKGGALNLWAAPMKYIAELTHDQRLLNASKAMPEWSVIPLVMDYDLKLGFIRCSIDKISIIGNSKRTIKYE